MYSKNEYCRINYELPNSNAGISETLHGLDEVEHFIIIKQHLTNHLKLLLSHSNVLIFCHFIILKKVHFTYFKVFQKFT